jgi:hypothetical protein
MVMTNLWSDVTHAAELTVSPNTGSIRTPDRRVSVKQTGASDGHEK